ncbi:MAG TPA: thiol:disulfide interchange protein DsbA/DsbL [Acidiferrobacteraceae bacterium]|nr:thiol:disulfide interchange protein DsbA/DsbL [Acidiferrobacteraceae bacterium]
MPKTLLVLLFGLTLPLLSLAHAATFRENHQYTRLFPSQPVTTGRNIEVREFFWYSCPHCFHLEPVLNAWLKHKPKGVTFIRTPAVLRHSWEPQARAFYAFQALGLVHRLHDAFFDAIHIRHRNLSDEARIVRWVGRHGVNPVTFKAAYDSFGVSTKIRNASALERAEGLDAVPTIVVQGRYMTNVGMAGGRAKMMQVVNFLVQKVRKQDR